MLDAHPISIFSPGSSVAQTERTYDFRRDLLTVLIRLGSYRRDIWAVSFKHLLQLPEPSVGHVEIELGSVQQ